MALGKGLGSLIPQGKPASKKTDTQSKAAPKEGLWHIPLSEIVPNPEQPRKHFEHGALEDLVKSIKAHGVMQPITVTEREDGGYELIAGERRFRASEIAGLATIPAVVRSATEQQKLELALIENIQRQQLNPVEEAFSFQRLMDEFGLTQQQVADQVGRSRSAVANTIRLLALPEVIQKALIDGKISAGKARAILSLNTEEQQLDMFAQMMGESVSVRDVEHAVSQKKSRKGSTRRDPNLASYEKKLEERLGTKVRMTQRGEKGKITIDYYSKDDLRRVLEEIL